MTAATHLYDVDFVEWADYTAELLRQRRFDEVDLEHLVEEIGGLAQHDRRSIRLKLTRVIMHLIAQSIDRERNDTRWRAAVLESLYDIELLLEASPSLREYAQARLEKIYQNAVKDALSVANITAQPGEPRLPEHCPYTLAQLLEGDLDSLRAMLA